MDLNQYLARIGYGGSCVPTRETLFALHRAHLLTIPYENLDIHLGRELTLDLEKIFTKLVHEERGGWCYEMNGLFTWALRELGFDVQMLSSVVGSAAHDGAPDDHLILLVTLDEPWLVDVGFGNAFLEPLPLAPGEYTQGFRTYRLEQHDLHGTEDAWLFHNASGTPYGFTLQLRTFDSFARRCHELQTLPDAGFVRSTTCQRFVDSGILVLRGAVLRTLTASGTDEHIIDNLTDYQDALSHQFGLRFEGIDTLWEKVWRSHLEWSA